MQKFFKNLTESDFFQSFILMLIVMTAAAMGLETSRTLADEHGDFFLFFSYFTQGVFILEIAARIIAAPSIKDFFRDRWNRFDFIIVALSLIPAIGSLALIARLFRVFRVLRVISSSRKLRSFMDSVAITADETACASVILLILGYIYAVSGYYLFSDIDPTHWDSFGKSFLTVFYLLLFQSIPEYAAPLVKHSAFSILYFIAFYMTVFSVLIGLIHASIHQKEKSDD